MSSPGSIFISYRRSDSISETGRIYDRLVSHFGRDHIFKDVDSIPFGVDFAEHLDQMVSQCQVVLVIIGKTWLTVTEANGVRRIDNPDDFVRIEVESALRLGIPVIPVLLEGSSVPLSSQLPESLQPLARRNGTEVGHDPRFHADMTRLIKGIEESLLKAAEIASEPEAQAPSSLRPGESSGNLRRPNSRLPAPLTRRRLLQVAGFSGVGVGAALLGKIASDRLQYPSQQTKGAFNFEVVTVNSQGEISERQSVQNKVFTEELSGGISLEMVEIPAGFFQMGSSAAEGYDNERPQRQVTMASFLMGKHSVTQAQWKAVAAFSKVEQDLDPEPSQFKGDNRPVERVNWYEAIEFCNRLSQMTGRKYRLPSEAEWEYACRAGTITPFHFGETITTDLANYRGVDNWELGGTIYSGSYGAGPKGQYRQQTTPVGSFEVANALGLYDMHGNVLEWCLDHWHENYQTAPKHGGVWQTGGDDSLRLLRGGSWVNYPDLCRSAHRFKYDPGYRLNVIGLRVVSVAPRTSS